MFIQEITFFSQSDAASLANLEKECFGDDAWSEANIIETMNNPYASVYGIVCGEEIAAWAITYSIVDDMQIASFAVNPKFRRQGYGTKLLQQIVSKAKQEQNLLSLEVRVSNTPAINLYKKCGFSVLGSRRSFYENPTEDAYIMMYDEEKL